VRPMVQGEKTKDSPIAGVKDSADVKINDARIIDSAVNEAVGTRRRITDKGKTK
jgi:hypothetical protein